MTITYYTGKYIQINQRRNIPLLPSTSMNSFHNPNPNPNPALPFDIHKHKKNHNSYLTTYIDVK